MAQQFLGYNQVTQKKVFNALFVASIIAGIAFKSWLVGIGALLLFIVVISIFSDEKGAWIVAALFALIGWKVGDLFSSSTASIILAILGLGAAIGAFSYSEDDVWDDIERNGF